jgi:hypothetical protein
MHNEDIARRRLERKKKHTTPTSNADSTVNDPEARHIHPYCFHIPSACLMVGTEDIPSPRDLAHKHSRQHAHEVSHIHRHDRQHAVPVSVVSRSQIPKAQTHSRYPTPTIMVVIAALARSVENLHGRPAHPSGSTLFSAVTGVCAVEASLRSSELLADGVVVVATVSRLSSVLRRAHVCSCTCFQASRKRKTKARTIRKMQVPVY